MKQTLHTSHKSLKKSSLKYKGREMYKIILALIMSSSLLLASGFKLDKESSNVYYEAKKDQFFSTYVILGLNKSLSGLLHKDDKKLKGELKIDADGFKTDSDMRDSNVAQHLNVDIRPFITFTFTIENSTANGEMTINGISKNLTFPVVIVENDSSIQIDGNITIKYIDFGLKTPSNLILSAHEDLVIGAKLLYKKHEL